MQYHLYHIWKIIYIILYNVFIVLTMQVLRVKRLFIELSINIDFKKKTNEIHSFWLNH